MSIWGRLPGAEHRRPPYPPIRACVRSNSVSPWYDPSLEVGDLVSDWGRTVVLNGVSLTTTHGSTLTVLGGNGAGKTTLFATLMGLTTLMAP